MKLGRKAVKTDSRTLRLARYLTAGLPPAPIAHNWTKGKTSWGMMLNDTLGDCTCAGCGHAVQVWTVNTRSEVTLPDKDILEAYEEWCGYVNGNPATDQGGVELDVLTDWRQSSLHGYKLLGFADPTVTNLEEIRQAIYLFGGVYIGMNVPNFIMDSIPAVWDVTADDGGIDGGHCVFVCGYDAGTFTFISWGSVYKMTIAFWNEYVDEAHALLSPNWIGAKGTPDGFNLSQLETDLAAIR
jgi:hypothetical protein